jgi:hypothetical protein
VSSKISSLVPTEHKEKMKTNKQLRVPSSHISKELEKGKKQMKIVP